MKMPQILNDAGNGFDLAFPAIVIGAGATGLTAALALRDKGVEVLVIERDSTPLGSTAMSTGLIPAAGTPEQRAAGIDDSAEIFMADLLRKTKGGTDPTIALRLAEQSADTIAWMRDVHGVPLDLVDGFLYPGHSARRSGARRRARSRTCRSPMPEPTRPR